MSLNAPYFTYMRYRDPTMQSSGQWHKIKNTNSEVITTECQLKYVGVELLFVVFSNEPHYGTQECETCREIMDTLGAY